MPQEEKEPVVFDFQDPSPPPMKAVKSNISTFHIMVLVMITVLVMILGMFMILDMFMFTTTHENAKV